MSREYLEQKEKRLKLVADVSLAIYGPKILDGSISDDEIRVLHGLFNGKTNMMCHNFVEKIGPHISPENLTVLIGKLMACEDQTTIMRNASLAQAFLMFELGKKLDEKVSHEGLINHLLQYFKDIDWMRAKKEQLNRDDNLYRLLSFSTLNHFESEYPDKKKQAEPLRKYLTEMAGGGKFSSKYDGLTKRENLTIQSSRSQDSSVLFQLDFLGDGRQGDAKKQKQDQFSTEKLNELLQNYEMDPLARLALIEGIYKIIKENQNNLYTHAAVGSSLPYTGTQEKHIKILQHALNEMCKKLEGNEFFEKKVKQLRDDKNGLLNFNGCFEFEYAQKLLLDVQKISEMGARDTPAYANRVKELSTILSELGQEMIALDDQSGQEKVKDMFVKLNGCARLEQKLPPSVRHPASTASVSSQNTSGQPSSRQRAAAGAPPPVRHAPTDAASSSKSTTDQLAGARARPVASKIQIGGGRGRGTPS